MRTEIKISVLTSWPCANLPKYSEDRYVRYTFVSSTKNKEDPYNFVLFNCLQMVRQSSHSRTNSSQTNQMSLPQSVWKSVWYLVWEHLPPRQRHRSPPKGWRQQRGGRCHQRWWQECSQRQRPQQGVGSTGPNPVGTDRTQPAACPHST